MSVVFRIGDGLASPGELFGVFLCQSRIVAAFPAFRGCAERLDPSLEYSWSVLKSATFIPHPAGGLEIVAEVPHWKTMSGAGS